MATSNNNRVFLITVFIFAAILLLALLLTSRGASKYEEGKNEKADVKKMPPIVQAYAARTEAPIEPDRAIELLKEGNKRYVTQKRLADPGVGKESRKFLTLGEWPYAVILGSSDSRVPPEYLFDAGLGDLTVIRVLGPVVDQTILATIESTMLDGKCRLLVVMGHKESRAIRNALNVVEHPSTSESYHQDSVVRSLIPSVLKARKNAHTTDGLKKAVAKENVRAAVRQIQAGSGELQRLVHSGKIKIVGAYADIASGEVEFLPDED
jgi:carbonic anhydrase